MLNLHERWKTGCFQGTKSEGEWRLWLSWVMSVYMLSLFLGGGFPGEISVHPYALPWRHRPAQVLAHGTPSTCCYITYQWCACIFRQCLNRNFFNLDFYSSNFFIYQPFKNLPLYNWELSTVLYTLLLETEFLFSEVQLLSGFNLAIEREKWITKL